MNIWLESPTSTALKIFEKARRWCKNTFEDVQEWMEKKRVVVFVTIILTSGVLPFLLPDQIFFEPEHPVWERIFWAFMTMATCTVICAFAQIISITLSILVMAAEYTLFVHTLLHPEAEGIRFFPALPLALAILAYLLCIIGIVFFSVYLMIFRPDEK